MNQVAFPRPLSNQNSLYRRETIRTPKTLVGRRIADRFRLSAELADQLGDLAGYTGRIA